jgi:hypothetical protein
MLVMSSKADMEGQHVDTEQDQAAVQLAVHSTRGERRTVFATAGAQKMAHISSLAKGS